MAKVTLTAEAIGAVLASQELGPKPKIRGVSDLASALYALARVSSLRKKVEAETEQQINDLREKQKHALTLTLNGKSIGCDEYERTYTQAIEEFVLEHRETVFTDGTKTVTYSAGTIALKDKPPWLQYMDGYTRKGIVAETIEAEGLLPKITNWLKRLSLRPWIKLTPDLDTTAITQAIKAGEITIEDLAEWGLSFEGAEIVVIKPADYTAATT